MQQYDPGYVAYSPPPPSLPNDLQSFWSMKREWRKWEHETQILQVGLPSAGASVWAAGAASPGAGAAAAVIEC